MDHRFMEFMGHYFTNAATYQKQTNNMLHWMNKWVCQDSSRNSSGFDETTSLFMDFYGIDGDASSENFSHAFKAFKTNYLELFSIPGMVSEEKHRKLNEKYQALKQKCESQEQTINTLLSVDRLNDTVQNNVTQGIELAMKNQKNIFENLLTGLSPC